MHKPRVLVFSAYFLPGYKGGGPIKTIANLLSRTKTDIHYRLVTSDRDLDDEEPYTIVEPGQWNKVTDTPVFYSQPGLKGLLQIFKILASDEYDLLYLNSFFSVRFSFFPLLVAKSLRKRLVLGPRGEFSEGALSLKRFKKSIFILIFKLLRLHKGIVFQASSAFEADDIRRVLGSEVTIRIAEDIGAQEFSDRLEAHTSGPLRAVFISRISPKKNLLAALEMLKKVRQNLVYDVYGPIEDSDYWQECKKIIKTLPSNIQVNHKGVLHPSKVVKALENYDVFFFPTKGENYGHVIAEALCAGLPILIADTTPWRDLQTFGIGWDLPLNDPESFSVVLDELATMPAEDHLNMRQKVLAWATNKFSQRDAVEANVALFQYAYQKK